MATKAFTAFAFVGDVALSIEGEPGIRILTRDTAIKLVGELASAIQMAGDMSEPDAVFLVEAAQNMLKGTNHE